MKFCGYRDAAGPLAVIAFLQGGHAGIVGPETQQVSAATLLPPTGSRQGQALTTQPSNKPDTQVQPQGHTGQPEHPGPPGQGDGPAAESAPEFAGVKSRCSRAEAEGSTEAKGSPTYPFIPEGLSGRGCPGHTVAWENTRAQTLPH